MEVAFRNLTEEQFDDCFVLVDNHIDDNAAFDGKMFETYGDEMNFVLEMSKQNRVITIIESDEGCEEDEEGFIDRKSTRLNSSHKA